MRRGEKGESMSVCKGDKDEGEEKEKGRKMYVSVYS